MLGKSRGGATALLCLAWAGVVSGFSMGPASLHSQRRRPVLGDSSSRQLRPRHALALPSRRCGDSSLPVLAGGGEGGGIGCNRREGDPWWRGDDGDDEEAKKREFLIAFAVMAVAGLSISALGPLACLIYAATGLSLLFLGLSALVTWPFCMEGKLVSDHMRVWSRIILALMGVKYDAVGPGKLDLNQHYVLAANHESLTDTALVYSVLHKRHLIAVGKKELSYVPVFGWLMYLGGHVVVDRKNHESAMKSMQRAEDSLIKRPRTVLVFPEGTRSRDGKLKDFKKGAFVLAIQTGLPVVPMAVIGTGDLLKADKLGMRLKGKIRLVIGDPIKTKGMSYKDRDKLCARVQKEVKKLRDQGRKDLGLPPAIV
mmetsp:Transcript_19035/g.46752  ORF Transcript_19035/g.46752 Transcript_19035/m.46752 type:complete len:370 (+) Transcript_19035:34-1143(+)